MAHRCVQRLGDLCTALAADELLKVFRAARMYELQGLRRLCCDRMRAMGAELLARDDVCDLLSTDRDLYKEVVNAACKRRRTE